MSTWIKVIAGVVQIALLIMKNKAKKQEVKDISKEELRKEVKDAIKARDVSRINAVAVKLRNAKRNRA